MFLGELSTLMWEKSGGGGYFLSTFMWWIKDGVLGGLVVYIDDGEKLGFWGIFVLHCCGVKSGGF